MALRLGSFLVLSALSALSPVKAVQPSAPEPIAAPLRDLKWGQLNFLHTTDTHGWLAGHLQEYEAHLHPLQH
jgi:2',3'-cyclic-nucleotide 2'-phosphodiesterase (5'-nucleotidase family)